MSPLKVDAQVEKLRAALWEAIVDLCGHHAKGLEGLIFVESVQLILYTALSSADQLRGTRLLRLRPRNSACRAR